MDITPQLTSTGTSALDMIISIRGILPTIARVVLVLSSTQDFAIWDPAGTLLLDSAQAASASPPTFPPRTIWFSFAVDNFDAPQAPRRLMLTGESGLIKRIGMCDDDVELGCDAFKTDGQDYPSLSRTVMQGGDQILLAGGSRPLAVATIAESELMKNHINTITVELQTPQSECCA